MRPPADDFIRPDPDSDGFIIDLADVFTSAELARLRAAAAQQSLSVGEYVKRKALGHLQ